MEYLFVPLWAALETGFAYLLFGSFLEPQCQKEEARYYFVAVWVLNTVYGLFRVEGVYGCLMYLLTAALMLLVIFGEKGPGGLVCWSLLCCYLSCPYQPLRSDISTTTRGSFYRRALLGDCDRQHNLAFRFPSFGDGGNARKLNFR